jgi:hypothetical protein
MLAQRLSSIYPRETLRIDASHKEQRSTPNWGYWLGFYLDPRNSFTVLIVDKSLYITVTESFLATQEHLTSIAHSLFSQNGVELQ